MYRKNILHWFFLLRWLRFFFSASAAQQRRLSEAKAYRRKTSKVLRLRTAKKGGQTQSV